MVRLSFICRSFGFNLVSIDRMFLSLFTLTISSFSNTFCFHRTSSDQLHSACDLCMNSLTRSTGSSISEGTLEFASATVSSHTLDHTINLGCIDP